MRSLRSGSSHHARRQTFPAWLAAQIDRDDAIGRLARTVETCTHRPSAEHAAFLARLRRADINNPARETLFEAIVEWGATEG
jgi:ferric-dicitrate binding protein FerR (iron transport regulator)